MRRIYKHINAHRSCIFIHFVDDSGVLACDNDRDGALKPLLLRETKIEAFSVVSRVRKKMRVLFT